MSAPAHTVNSHCINPVSAMQYRSILKLNPYALTTPNTSDKVLHHSMGDQSLGTAWFSAYGKEIQSRSSKHDLRMDARYRREA